MSILLRKRIRKTDAPLAQLVEQLTLNQWVRSSSLRRCTSTEGRAAEKAKESLNNTVGETDKYKLRRNMAAEPTPQLVLLSHRVHLYPFRTQKLSCAEPKILDWRRSGKIGQCQHKCKKTLLGKILKSVLLPENN